MRIHQIRRLSSTSYMKRHKSYSQAKTGDIEAARKLISDIIHLPVKLNNKIDFVCPVMKPSGNRIPVAFAELLTSNFNRIHCNTVFLQNKRHGSSMVERLYYQPTFSGFVKPGNYMIVDDVYTTGQTLKYLKNYIESSGGNVYAAWCIGSGPSLQFEPARLQIKILLAKFPELTDYFDVSKLTVPQVNYHMRLSSINHLRKIYSDKQLQLLYA
jgi:hypoxanthine-guanine phosphoribosyltransferase